MMEYVFVAEGPLFEVDDQLLGAVGPLSVLKLTEGMFCEAPPGGRLLMPTAQAFSLPLHAEFVLAGMRGFVWLAVSENLSPQLRVYP